MFMLMLIWSVAYYFRIFFHVSLHHRDDFKYKNKEARDCDWLEDQPKKMKRDICKKNWKKKAVKTHWCPETCGGCE